MRQSSARAGSVAGGLVLALVLALALLLSGCSAGGGASSSADGGSVAAPETAPDGGGGGDAEPAVAADRQVVTSASATVTADDPLAAAGEVARRVEGAGGRVEQRSEHAGGGEDGGADDPASAELVVRVPADALTGVLDGLADLGAVGQVQVTSDDVTADAVDLDARITALATSVERLQALLAGAATTADLVAAEDALSERQAELESLQSQRRLLAGQVELSTLTVLLVAGDPVSGEPAGGPDGFVEALGLGWRGLVGAGRGLAVAAGVLLPWALALAVVGALAAAAVRGARRLLGRRGAAPASGPQVGQ